MAPYTPPAQANSDDKSHQSTEHVPSRELACQPEDVTVLSPPPPSYSQNSLLFLGFEGMWEKPLYTASISPSEDDPLADTVLPEPGSIPPFFSSPTVVGSGWSEVALPGSTPTRLSDQDWTPVQAWLADVSDTRVKLWESVSDVDDYDYGDDDDNDYDYADNDDDVEVEGNNEEEYQDANENHEPLTYSLIDRLNSSVGGQWNASSIEGSIGSLKSAMRKLQSIASPEGSVAEDRNLRWTSLLRL